MSAPAKRIPLTDHSPTRELPYLLALGGLLAWLYAHPFARMVRSWFELFDSSHGVVVFGIAAYLAARQVRGWKALPRQASPWGYFFLLIGLALYAPAYWLNLLFPQLVSMWLVGWGILLQCAGGARARTLLFPYGFLLFALPLPEIVSYPVRQPMQRLTVSFVPLVVGLLGVPVERQGVAIHGSHYSVAVVLACSGFRMLLPLLALSTLLGRIWKADLWRRVLLLALAFPAAVALNVIRISAIIITGEFRGESAAMWVHDHISPVLLFLFTLGFLLMRGWFACERKQTPTGDPATPS